MKRAVFTLLAGVIVAGLGVGTLQAGPGMGNDGGFCVLTKTDGEFTVCLGDTVRCDAHEDSNPAVEDRAILGSKEVVKTRFNDQSGNGIIICHAQVQEEGDTELPSSTLIFTTANTNGKTCDAGGQSTTNWHSTITPNGEGHLQCIFSPAGQ